MRVWSKRNPSPDGDREMPTTRCLSCNGETYWRNRRGSRKPTTCGCGGQLAARMYHPLDIQVELDYCRQQEAYLEAELAAELLAPTRIWWTPEFMQNRLAACRTTRAKLEARLAKMATGADYGIER